MLIWEDGRCFLTLVFLVGARRLELPPCNTTPGMLTWIQIVEAGDGHQLT